MTHDLRRIDQLVAEHIFGIEVRKARWDDGEEFLVPNVLTYSSDIAAAWLVVEKMGLQWSGRSCEDGVIEFEFWTEAGPNSEEGHGASAKTLSLAIALASLKAKGVSVE